MLIRTYLHRARDKTTLDVAAELRLRHPKPGSDLARIQGEIPVWAALDKQIRVLKKRQ
jgi:hypothetical protein